MSDIEPIDAILMACEELNVHNPEKCSLLEEGQALNFIYNKACIVKKEIRATEIKLQQTKDKLVEAEKDINKLHIALARMYRACMNADETDKLSELVSGWNMHEAKKTLDSTKCKENY